MNNFSLLESENHDMPQLSSQENEILTARFTEEEIHDAIMQMEKNKASGPDGSLLNFTKIVGIL